MMELQKYDFLMKLWIAGAEKKGYVRPSVRQSYFLLLVIRVLVHHVGIGIMMQSKR